MTIENRNSFSFSKKTERNELRSERSVFRKRNPFEVPKEFEPQGSYFIRGGPWGMGSFPGPEQHARRNGPPPPRPPREPREPDLDSLKNDTIIGGAASVAPPLLVTTNSLPAFMVSSETAATISVIGLGAVLGFGVGRCFRNLWDAVKLRRMDLAILNGVLGGMGLAMAGKAFFGMLLLNPPVAYGSALSFFGGIVTGAKSKR